MDSPNFDHKQRTFIPSGDTLFPVCRSKVVQPVNMFSSASPESSVWSAGVLITSLQTVHTQHNTTQQNFHTSVGLMTTSGCSTTGDQQDVDVLPNPDEWRFYWPLDLRKNI